MKKIIAKTLVILFVISISVGYNDIFADVNTTVEQGAIDNLVTYEVSMTAQEYHEYNKSKEITLQTFENDSNLEKIRLEVYKGIDAIKTSIDISTYCTEINADDYNKIFDIYFEILYEKPELFYMPLSVGLSISSDSSTGKIINCSLEIIYKYEKEEIISMKEKFNSKVNFIKERYLKGIDDELQKEYIIYEYIVSNTEYDPAGYWNEPIPDISHTAYGSLVNGVAVCDGYSLAAKLLFNEVGIESGLVTSRTMNHAWNYVKINGQYYNLDLTWDYSSQGEIGYNYFNLSNDEISKDHTWDEWSKDKYPIANNDSFKFLREKQMSRVDNKLYFIDYNKNSIESTNLTGKNQVSILTAENHNIQYLIPYNNTLNFIYDNGVKSYNTKTQKIDTIYTGTEYINSLDIKNDTLLIKNYSGVIDSVSLKINEDLNYDSVVDIVDLATIAKEYNNTLDKLGINNILDLNKDGIIDILDMVQVAKNIH